MLRRRAAFCTGTTNFGSSRFVGGLNLAANLLGKPGKMDVQGHMVQDLFNAGKLADINDYCRSIGIRYVQIPAERSLDAILLGDFRRYGLLE